MFYRLSKKIKPLSIGIAVYAGILIIYDLLFGRTPPGEIAETYLTTAVVCVLMWFGIQLVIWIQIINKACPDAFLNLWCCMALFVFGVGSIISVIQYFIDGVIDMALLIPVCFLAVIKIQTVRWKKRGAPDVCDNDKSKN